MAATNGDLTHDIVMALLARKMTVSEIAELYGVSKQAVSYYRHSRGARGAQLTLREEAMQHFPWQVLPQLVYSSPHRLLRYYMEYVVTRGSEMSLDKVKRLSSWIQKLMESETVLEYDPEIPPRKNLKDGGYAYRSWEERDGDLVIRVNQFTRLTEKGRWLLARPSPELLREIHKDASKG